MSQNYVEFFFDGNYSEEAISKRVMISDEEESVEVPEEALGYRFVKIESDGKKKFSAMTYFGEEYMSSEINESFPECIYTMVLNFSEFSRWVKFSNGNWNPMEEGDRAINWQKVINFC